MGRSVVGFNKGQSKHEEALHEATEKETDLRILTGWGLGVKLTGDIGFQMNKHGGKMYLRFSRKKTSSSREKWFMNDMGRQVGLD